jgi:hypothetical protein
MTNSTSRPNKTIGTKSRKVGYRDTGGMFRPPHTSSWTVLDSRELIRSLHIIKDAAVEPHTKNNIQILIDQIDDQELTV